MHKTLFAICTFLLLAACEHIDGHAAVERWCEDPQNCYNATQEGQEEPL